MAVTAKVPVCVAAPLAKTLNKVAPVVEATSSNLVAGVVWAEVEIANAVLGVVVPTPTKLLTASTIKVLVSTVILPLA